MTEQEIQAALDEIFDADYQKQSFQNWCELMEAEFGTNENPEF